MLYKYWLTKQSIKQVLFFIKREFFVVKKTFLKITFYGGWFFPFSSFPDQNTQNTDNLQTQNSQTIDISPPQNLAIDPNAVTLNDFVRFIINLLVVIGVLAALAFLILGGIRWILSGGDKAGVEAARGAIIAAVIGLVVVLLSWVILNIIFALIGLGGFSTELNIPTLTNPNI